MGARFGKRLCETADEMNPDHALKILEGASYVSNVLLFFAALYGFKQVRIALAQFNLTKKDIQDRSNREAGMLAANQCEKYATHIIPHADALVRCLREKSLFKKWSPNSDFSSSEPKQFELWYQLCRDNPDFEKKVTDCLNVLESIAIYFHKELADESVAFPSLGRNFCELCEVFYPYLSHHRRYEQHRLYQSTVALYKLWSPRLEGQT